MGYVIINIRTGKKVSPHYFQYPIQARNYLTNYFNDSKYLTLHQVS